jgi:hypothetical protein
MCKDNIIICSWRLQGELLYQNPQGIPFPWKKISCNGSLEPLTFRLSLEVCGGKCLFISQLTMRNVGSIDVVIGYGRYPSPFVWI